MTLFEIVGNVLIGPLKLLFEIIFDLAGRFIDHPGLCIIVLSLVMNSLIQILNLEKTWQVFVIM